MSTSQKIIYFFSSLTILLVLALLEFFIGVNFLDMISNAYLARLIASLLCILIINPIITKIIMDSIEFKPNNNEKKKSTIDIKA